MVRTPWWELLLLAGVWAATFLALLLVARGCRRGVRANEPIATPPIETQWRPYGPLSTGARFLVGANIVMTVLIVAVCFSQPGFSPLWAAYFSAEAVLFLGTVVFAIGRRGSLRT